MIVLDASAVVEMLLATPRGDVLNEELLGNSDEAAAPHLIDSEVTHTLRKAWLRGDLDAERGQQALDDLIDLPLRRFSHLRLLPRVWELRHDLTAYDAIYVALAEQLDATLVTFDARLARAPSVRIRVDLRS